jgi:hypothetical protein
MMAVRSDGQELDRFVRESSWNRSVPNSALLSTLRSRDQKAGQIHNERNDKMKTEWIQCRSKENSSAA